MTTRKTIVRWIISFVLGAVLTFFLGRVLVGDFVTYSFDEYRFAFITYTVGAVLFGSSLAAAVFLEAGHAQAERARADAESAAAQAEITKLERSAALDAKRRVDRIRAFREADPLTKRIVAAMYRDDRVDGLTEREFFAAGLQDWAGFDKVSGGMEGGEVMVSAFLADETRAMLDANPELLEVLQRRPHEGES